MFEQLGAAFLAAFTAARKLMVHRNHQIGPGRKTLYTRWKGHPLQYDAGTHQIGGKLPEDLPALTRDWRLNFDKLRQVLGFAAVESRQVLRNNLRQIARMGASSMRIEDRRWKHEELRKRKLRKRAAAAAAAHAH